MPVGSLGSVPSNIRTLNIVLEESVKRLILSLKYCQVHGRNEEKQEYIY